jgi:aldose 1-epimerase
MSVNTGCRAAVICMITAAFCRGGFAAEAVRAPFGTLADGTRIEAVELSSGHGVSVRILTLGAIIQSLSTPDRAGRSSDIVLGFDTPQEYLDDHNFFGATVGRFANRIAKGRFELDGRGFTLAANDHGNHLHGGRKGFDKAVWSIDSISSGTSATVVLSHVSPDGDEGYPGTLRVTATFSLDAQNALQVDYRATTDKATIVNLSNHSYFNLSSDSAFTTALDQIVEIAASRYTPVDAQLIPTGELRSVAGTPFDFRQPKPAGLRIRDGREQQIRYGRGYDHNFVLDGVVGASHLAARITDPVSGRRLEIFTTAPGLQFYSGNFLDGTIVGKGGRIYRQGDALAFEPQVFPDAPNHADFPSSRLDPGATYLNSISYRFSTVTPRHPGTG